MNQLEILSCSLEYIENHLESDIRTEDVARACYCSKSTLEKLFRCINNISVRDYLIRRRMTKAARVLVEQPDKGILEIALEYGYTSNESFTRAFRKVWNSKPSEFRRNVKFCELFPRLDIPLEKGENYMKRYDISELYDLLQERRNCYFVLCDIKHMIEINEISLKAGDLAILETLRRMNEVAGEEDIVFRIGGDEFVMLTNSEEEAYAKGIAEQIQQYNTHTFLCDGKEIPLFLHIGITKVEQTHCKYQELFTKLHDSIMEIETKR